MNGVHCLSLAILTLGLSTGKADDKDEGPVRTKPEPAPVKAQDQNGPATSTVDRLILLRTLVEAAEEGARRRHGERPFAIEAIPDQDDSLAGQLANAVQLLRRLRAARAAWHAGADAWAGEWRRSVPEPFLASSPADPAARCVADVLVERLIDAARVLVDPTVTDQVPVKAHRPAADAIAGPAVPAPRGDGVAVASHATAAAMVYHPIPTWSVLGPYADPGELPHSGVEIPTCLPAPGLPHRLGTDQAIIAWRRVAAKDGRIALGPQAGRFHASAGLETPWAEDRWLRLQSAGDLALWIDGRPVWSRRGPVAEEIRVRLDRGRHSLLLDGRVSAGQWFACDLGSATPLDSKAALPPSTAEAKAVLARVKRREWMFERNLTGISDLPAIPAIPVWRMHRLTFPPCWLLAEPLPSDPNLDASSWRPALDSPLPGGATTWRLVEAGQIRHHRAYEIEGLYFRLLYRESNSFPVPLLFGPQPSKALGKTLALATVIDNDRHRLCTLVVRGPGMRAWLDGRKMDGSRNFRLSPGRHLLVLLTTMRAMPPAFLFSRMVIRAGLTDVGGTRNQEAAQPLALDLLRIVRHLSGTPQADQARAALDLLAVGLDSDR